MMQHNGFKMIEARKIGKIEHLLLYPVKSCASIELEGARITKRGLETASNSPVRDREYLVVDAVPESSTRCHKFLTQRDRGLQKLVLITPKLREGRLELSFENQDRMLVSDMPVGKELPVRVYDDLVTGVDQGDQVAKMLSDYLGRSVRLVRSSGSFNRSARQNYVSNDNTLSYQDAYSINWLFQESIAELQKSVNQEISYLNFRPNVVASGGPANSEHEFYHVRMDGVEGIQPKPCTRCMIVNVNHETGTIKPGRRLPLRAIYENYNWVDRDGQRQGIFSENFLPNNEGVVRRSGEIAALSLRDPQLQYGKISKE